MASIILIMALYGQEVFTMAYGLVYDYLMGQCIEAHNYFGAHFTKQGKKDGVKELSDIQEVIVKEMLFNPFISYTVVFTPIFFSFEVV